MICIIPLDARLHKVKQVHLLPLSEVFVSASLWEFVFFPLRATAVAAATGPGCCWLGFSVAGCYGYFRGMRAAGC